MERRRPACCWQCRGHELRLGARTLVMGILNVTPDSFADGGCYLDPEQALDHALAMAAAGADILDIGGESTRPGAAAVSEAEEARRIMPVVRALAGRTTCLLSIDTRRALVARMALDAGAAIINDVSALTHDPAMAGVVIEAGAGVILMHMQGQPATMQQAPAYTDVVGEVTHYLAMRIQALVEQGMATEHLAVDPGIGFGKTLEHNLQLLAALPTFAPIGRPVVVGASRKSFLGRITGREPPERLAASLGAAAYAMARGAHVVRVHDVRETRDVAAVVDALSAEEDQIA